MPAAFFGVELDGDGQAARTWARWSAPYIARLLELTGGNRTAVARLLGVSYPTVAKKISDYGLG